MHSYQMAMFSMTWVTPNSPNQPIFFAFFVFVLGERKIFKLGTQVDCS